MLLIFFRALTFYGGNVAALATSTLPLQIDSGSFLTLASGIECVSETVAFAATYSGTPNRYTCTIANQAPQNAKTVTVSLQYRAADSSVITLSSTPATVHFYTTSAIAFTGTINNAVVFGTSISLTIAVAANTIPAGLLTMARTFFTSSFASTTAATTGLNQATFTYTCNHDSVLGYMEINIAASGTNKVNISLNALPATCVSMYILCFLIYF